MKQRGSILLVQIVYSGLYYYLVCEMYGSQFPASKAIYKMKHVLIG